MFENMDKETKDQIIKDYIENKTDEEKAEISYLISKGQTKLVRNNIKEEYEKKNSEVQKAASIDPSISPSEEKQSTKHF